MANPRGPLPRQNHCTFPRYKRFEAPGFAHGDSKIAVPFSGERRLLGKEAVRSEAEP